MRSEHTQLLDILAMRDFHNKKDRLLLWVLLYDLWESTEMSKNAYGKVLLERGIVSTLSQWNNYMSNIEWALEYDDDFGFTGDYENAQLVGEFTSLGEIKSLRDAERSKKSKKTSPKNDFDVIAKRITNGMNKKQREALAIAILAL